MTLSSWLSLVAVAALGAMSPGPSLAVVARQTFASSRRHGLAAAISHGAGVGLYAVLVLLGLGTLLTAVPELSRILTLAGAAYLAWLGIQALRSKQGLAPAGTDLEATDSVAKAAREGFLIAFLNPKLAVFFGALFAQFMGPGQGLGVQAVMAVTVWLIDTGWYLLVVMLLSRPSWLGWFRRHGVWIERGTGVVLLLIAARVITL